MPVAAGIDALPATRRSVVGGGRRLVGVGDAEAAAEVEVVDPQAVRLDRLDQVQQAVERVEVRLGLGDLRADVAVDADHLEAGQRGARR